jgi:hypothetical protein
VSTPEDAGKQALLALSTMSKEALAELVKSLTNGGPKEPKPKGLTKVYKVSVVCTCKLCGSINSHTIMSAWNKDIALTAPTCSMCKSRLIKLPIEEVIDKLIHVASIGDPTIHSIQSARPMPIYVPPVEAKEFVEPISLELVEHDKELIELIEQVAEGIEVADET